MLCCAVLCCALLCCGLRQLTGGSPSWVRCFYKGPDAADLLHRVVLVTPTLLAVNPGRQVVDEVEVAAVIGDPRMAWVLTK